MSPTEERLLTLDAVTMQYPAPDGTPGPVVLRDLSLAVRAGDSLAIVGPSGSGKSTLLHLMAGLDRPGTGRVSVEGRDLASLSEGDLADLRSRRIGLVFQLHHLLPQCTALENVLVPTLPLRDRAARAAAPARARRLLERVGLGDRLDYRPAQLSGGQCQRVALARALINGPALLLADEPTGSLDHATALAMADLLAALNREEQVTLIVVTHAPEVAARMQRRLLLRDGRLEACAP
jgi:predicted ABC-type transport system involved in lysophospholipase L1 biosynthesis ATPase subunit